ncbi:hypothetical protein [Companilactobacillus sp. HBUAS59544]|uniref:hypothetical protein n=1 Tax=Companilactobacillus sp. HBUAS59544 TaxID=3109363 RepID=UPI002FF41BD2
MINRNHALSNAFFAFLSGGSMPSSIAKPILAGTMWADLEPISKPEIVFKLDLLLNAKALSRISHLSQIGFAIPD